MHPTAFSAQQSDQWRSDVAKGSSSTRAVAAATQSDGLSAESLRS